MSKESKNMIVPKLRFPEFRGSEEWEEKKLAALSLKIGDGIHATPIYDEDGDYFFINGNNLIDGKIICDDKTKKVSEEEFEKYKTQLGLNTILLSINGTIGNISFYNNEKVILGKSACFINVDETKLNKKFAASYLGTDTIAKYFDSELTGSTIKNLSLKSVRDTILRIPGYKEQQKIASCLSSLDDLITAENQKLQALKAHKKGLMQQLFPAEGEIMPKLRFAEFRGSGKWEEKKLIDVADKSVKWSFTGGPFGSKLKASDYVERGIRVIQLQNIGDGEFLDSYKIFTSLEKADELLSCNIYPGEIILSKMGDPVGRACFIPETNSRYVMCSDGIRLVVNESLYNKYFVFTLINSIPFRTSVEKTATGSTRKRIGLDDLKNLPMMIPPNLKEQQKIASCLSSLDELITSQAEKIEALKEHKKGLMQQLFPQTVENFETQNNK